MTRMVALLRAVNVGGRKVPMAELRDVAVELGWDEVSTYIQSGNLLFTATGKPPALEAALEQALETRFGINVPVMVRTDRSWSDLRAQNPFSDIAREAPNRLMLMVSKAPPAAGAEAAIQARAKASEQIRGTVDAIWIHYPEGVGRSKLTPSLIDRAIGSSSTARNFRTVTKLEEKLAE